MNFSIFYFFRWLVIACCVSMLAGCMTAVYVAGSVSNLSKAQYQQTAVLDIRLTIDGTSYRLRAPVGCRSFVHPVGGVRVTRSSGELFEFVLDNGDHAYLRVSYACAEDDAEIRFGGSSIASVYRVKKTPALFVIQDWAVPKAQLGIWQASVVINESYLDSVNNSTNVVVVESLLTALKQRQVGDKNLMLMALFSPRISLDGGYVDASDAQELQKFLEPQPVPPLMRKRIVDRLNKSGYGSPQVAAAELAFRRDETPFELVGSEGIFRPLREIAGRRMYYPLPVDNCPESIWCRVSKTKLRVGALTIPTNDFSMIYDPSERVIYLRQLTQL